MTARRLIERVAPAPHFGGDHPARLPGATGGGPTVGVGNAFSDPAQRMPATYGAPGRQPTIHSEIHPQGGHAVAVMRLLLADDQTLIREALAALLPAVDSSFAVMTASSLEEVVAMFDGGALFDLILLDDGMEGMDGLVGLHRVRAVAAGCPVAIVSANGAWSYARAAIAADAAGFLPKSMNARSMANAIRFMALGERFVPVDLEEDELRPPSAHAHNGSTPILTSRERQVLDGLCRGLANKEIARELELQEVTIKLHVKTLCRKLTARNRTQAAMIAREAGLA